VRRPRLRWTLRTRMVVAIATLTAIALIVADVAGLSLLRSYLINRLDQQLTMSAAGYAHPRGGGQPPPMPGPRPSFMRNPDTDVRVYVYDGSGTLVDSGGDAAGTQPVVGPYQTVAAHAGGAPYTVDGAWRVVVARRPKGDTVAVALSLGQVSATADRLIAIDVAVSLLVLLLLTSAAASAVRIGLHPLTEMETTAQQIAAGDLSRRIADAPPHTEAGRLGLALNAMLTQIQAALHARTASERRLRQFLADASHELRTPLTSIQGFAELYRRGGARPGPELDEAMGRIEAEAARMAVLVGDLLLLARLDEERPLERGEVDLYALAADTVRDAAVRAPHRRVRLAELDCCAAADAPPEVHGDEARLRQVAANLVANALTHTPAEARIEVRVGRCRAAELTDDEPPVAVGPAPVPHAPVAVLDVVDTGPGMAPEQASRAFERLYRADPSRQRGTGGAGLGLSIVAAIVVAHGGRVELRTAPGAGTRFRVLLPAIVVSEITGREILGTGADASLAGYPTGTK
jgi:two-component system, OmpR family, sensor kinase